MPFSTRRTPTSGRPAKDKPKQPAKRYMIWLLSRQDYSAKALRDKLLSKEYPLDEVDTALAWAQENGYQSDERYARVRANSTSQKQGNRRLTMGLQQKGIAADLAKAQLENLPPEEERVLNVVRKFEGKPLTQELRQKIYRFLGTRGFMGKPVKTAFRHLEDKLRQAGEDVEDAGDDFLVDE
jgi:regulatory protein